MEFNTSMLLHLARGGHLRIDVLLSLPLDVES